jgi:hypothetical protein
MNAQRLEITAEKVTPNALAIKALVALIFVLAACAGLWLQYPFQLLPENYLTILAVFRVAFFLWVLCRLWFGRHAAALLWGHESVCYLKPILTLWFVVALAGLIGFGGAYSHYLNAIIFFIVFYRSKYYSIEDIYYQLGSFILLFLPTTAMLSFDSLISFHPESPLQQSPGITLLALNMYAWLLALMLLSAATEKALTPNWRKGLSFYYFIALPHLTLPFWRWLKNHKLLCQFASWMTVLGQGSLFLGYFIPILLPLLWLKQCAFGLLLICVVDLSFIGQLFVTQFLLFLGVTLFSSGNGGVGALAVPQPEFGLWLSITFMVFAVVRSFFSETLRYRQFMPKIADQCVRVLSGSCPVKVFSDAHLFGLYVYQVIDEKGNNVLPAFENNCGPGKLQRWHPRYYQGAMYSVTDICLAKRYWAEYEGGRDDRLNDLLAAGFSRAAEAKKLTLCVKAINPSEYYEKETAHWVDAEWTEIYQGQRDGGRLAAQWVGEPPAVKKTARNFKR